MTVILFLLVLAILIFVHELGHFVIARACGIKVTAFALGFGPKIFSKTVGETTYSLNLIPFGGYVSIFGEDPNDESISGPEKDRSFVSKSKLEQIGVLAAGVTFNFIFAAILIAIAFTVGAPASIGSYPGYEDRISERHIIVSAVNGGSPAEISGLKAGDFLIANSLEEVQDSINNSKGKSLVINYSRNGVVGSTTVLAKQGIVDGKYAIGIAMDYVGTLKLPFYLSVYESARYTWYSITKTVLGVFSLIGGIFNGSSHLSEVTGPIGIAGMVGSAAKTGFTYLLMFTAMISINLGVLNFMPFPALDGGRIFFVIIEAIIRRPIKPAIANTTNAVGFGLLIILMLVVTYRDIVHLFVK